MIFWKNCYVDKGASKDLENMIIDNILDVKHGNKLETIHYYIHIERN